LTLQVTVGLSVTSTWYYQK